jgi:hypothetical protein
MLTRSEIIAKAAQFASDWKDAKDEDAEAKSFWDALFLVFGTPRKSVASFEVPIKRTVGTTGFIDVLWKGKLLVEHKSKGKSLVDARKQAQEYVLELKPADRPQWVVVCDFDRFEVIEQATGAEQTFQLSDLSRNIDALGFIGGFQPRKPSVSAPVNIKAVELLGKIYDTLKAGSYPQHDLPPLLVRLLFALFAEDTAIFEPEQFRTLILDHSKADGSDLGGLLDAFFEVLNTDPSKRQPLLPEHLAAFPYVNGALFDHRLPNAAMNKAMRDALLAATEFDWTQISPAIFGSLFQSVMEGVERRALGAHYTSEEDILKLIKPLFLDDLDTELDVILKDAGARRDTKLDLFHDKLTELTFLDPACGCGNFLIIAYRELRRLETKLLVERYKATASSFLDIDLFVKLNVDAMYGIELEEFPAEIAKVGMWLMDHICNTDLAAAFGKSFTRLPLKKSAKIACANALTIDWASVLPADECSYVFGNPPFIGKKEQSSGQKEELLNVFGGAAGAGNLDFVCAWYAVAAKYIASTHIRCAFVSTNSISQGEQVAGLWQFLFKRHIKIDFAHRTFQWRSEARGKAHVHVVIIGFSLTTTGVSKRQIFDHADPKLTRVVDAANINPYLVSGSDTVVTSLRNPLSPSAPKMDYGSMMIDKSRKAGADEGLVFDDKERDAIVAECSELSDWIRPIYGGDEYLSGMTRYCLWMPTAPPKALASSKRAIDRVNKVRMFRLGSTRAQTRKLAAVPYRFGEVRQPTHRYLFVPKVSSERRTYLPISLLDPVIIASGSALVIDNASLFQFGVLSSSMHNAWMRAVGGRLELRYQYSASVIYNSFAWPAQLSAQQAAVETAATAVLEARASNSSTAIGDLYDPNLMPANLVKAHEALDRAVDACYRKQTFASEMDRVEYLFRLYEAQVAPLAITKPKRGKRKQLLT